MGCASSSSTFKKISDNGGRFYETYSLGKKLGEGSFGQVRVGQHRQTKEDFAVKILNVWSRDQANNYKVNKAALRAAREEIAVWKKIGRHENCVELKHEFYEEPLCLIVMEKCECSIMDKLLDMPNMTEADMARVFRQMLLGIIHVHSKNVIHRDIKPDNFLFGGPTGRTVKLADYGLSVELPKSGTVVGVSGTAPYMSPEMIGGIGYDIRTDIFSYGATAYLMLLGDFPYSPAERTPPAMKKAILTGKPAPTYVRAHDDNGKFVPPSSKSVSFLKALLERNSEKRPSGPTALKAPFLADQDDDVEKKPDEEKKKEPAPILKDSSGGEGQKKSRVSFDMTNEGENEADLPLRSAVGRARHLTRELKRPVNPIVQKSMDELLVQLEVKYVGGKSSNTVQFFSENDGDATEPKPAEETVEDRIRHSRSDHRHSTHSGVMSQEVSQKSARSSTPSTDMGEESSQASERGEFDPRAQFEKDTAMRDRGRI